MKTINSLIFIFLLSLVLNLSAQTKSTKNTPPLTDGSPESVGMSAERLARIDAM